MAWLPLLSALSVSVVVSGPAPGGAWAAAGAPVATAAVQVTGNPSPVRDYSSPLIARNPKNDELVTAEVDVRGTRECTVHISTDQGRSWAPGGSLMVKPFTDCSIGAEYGSYFSVFFDRNGVLYVPFAANDPALKAAPRPVETEDERDFIPRHVFLARSTDGGRTFATSDVWRSPEGKPDNYSKGVVGAVDPSNPRYVYVGWRQGAFSSSSQKLKNPVAVSTDGGRSFAPPVDISTDLGADHPGLSVGPDGTVHAVSWSRTFKLPDPTPPRPIFYNRSTDHGKTWQRKEIDPGNDRSYRSPLIAADPHSNAVYVVWWGSATLKNAELKSADRTDVFLRASTDGGKTWSDRRVVNDDPGKGVNHTYAGLDIAPDGRVDVAWYDGRLSTRPAGDPEEEAGFTDIFSASSTDRGRTFTPNVRISDRSADRSVGVWSNSVGSAGPVGVASTNDMVWYSWQDTRNGNALTQAEDVYVASLEVNGAVPAPAARAASGVPRWILLAGGIAAGMGLTMALVWVFARKPAASTAPVGRPEAVR